MERKRAKSGEIRLTEVAKLAGVSPITASRFFRNPDALSPSKRERVASAAKELGYKVIGIHLSDLKIFNYFDFS